ncbi:unnamed protein product, partial [Iphiclides podalirius]
MFLTDDATSAKYALKAFKFRVVVWAHAYYVNTAEFFLFLVFEETNGYRDAPRSVSIHLSCPYGIYS